MLSFVSTGRSVRASLACGGFRPSVAATATLLALLPPALSAANVAPRMLLLDVAPAGGALLAVGERGTILRSADQGRTWQGVAAPTRATLTAVSCFAEGAAARGWAVGHDAVILGTADGGHSWVKQYQGESLQDSFLDVLAIDAQHVIAIGAYALYVSTTDGGKTWSRRKILEDDYHLNRITRGPTGTLYLAGEHGTLLRSADRGATWRPLTAPYEGSFYGLLPLEEKTLLAYGLRGHAFRSTDDGQTWARVSTPAPALLATGLRLANDRVLLAGQARTLFVSRDLGQTFTPAPKPIATAVAELIALPGGGGLAVGEAGATLLGDLE